MRGGGVSNTHEHVKTRFKLVYLSHQNNSSSSFLQHHIFLKKELRDKRALCVFLLQFKKMAINWFSSDLVNFLSDDLIHSYINCDTLLVIVFLVFVDRIKQNKHKQNGHVKQCKYDNNNYIRLELINRK